jgi:hypothetical protein
MPEKELTSVQRYVLITMMINAAPLKYGVVKNSLSAPKRNELVNWELIEVGGRPMTLELTQKGHDRAVAELDADQPSGSGTAGMALHAAMGFLRELIARTPTEPRELFRSRLAATGPDAGLDERIRKAYSSLSPRPGDYIMLEDLREALPDVGRRDLDAALIELNRAREVSLVPESNQKVLTEGQRAAAVSIGNQFKHLIAIGV